MVPSGSKTMIKMTSEDLFFSTDYGNTWYTILEMIEKAIVLREDDE